MFSLLFISRNFYDDASFSLLQTPTTERYAFNLQPRAKTDFSSGFLSTQLDAISVPFWSNESKMTTMTDEKFADDVADPPTTKKPKEERKERIFHHSDDGIHRW
jgi:hypothetical protein